MGICEYFEEACNAANGPFGGVLKQLLKKSLTDFGTDPRIHLLKGFFPVNFVKILMKIMINIENHNKIMKEDYFKIFDSGK